MRHNRKMNHLGRTNAHRKAMLSNLATSLIIYKRIKTTLAKAKALRIYIEPIITKSKEDTTHARRLAFGYLQDKKAVSELFREISPKIADRPGGYTRILKIGSRSGDAAEMCYIELVDYNESMLAAKAAAETKAVRRSRRGSKKKTEAEADKSAKTKIAPGKPHLETREAEPADDETIPEKEVETKTEESALSLSEEKEVVTDVAESEEKEDTKAGDKEAGYAAAGEEDAEDKEAGSSAAEEKDTNKKE